METESLDILGAFQNIGAQLKGLGALCTKDALADADEDEKEEIQAHCNSLPPKLMANFKKTQVKFANLFSKTIKGQETLIKGTKGTKGTLRLL